MALAVASALSTGAPLGRDCCATLTVSKGCALTTYATPAVIPHAMSNIQGVDAPDEDEGLMRGVASRLENSRAGRHDVDSRAKPHEERRRARAREECPGASARTDKQRPPR